MDMVKQKNSLRDGRKLSLSIRNGTKSSSYCRIHQGYLLFNLYFRTKTLSIKEIPKTLTKNQSNHELLSLQFGRMN
jgi:hypothetical protein